MRWVYKMHLRFRSLFQKNRVEQELTDELRLHLESLIEEKVAEGMPPEEARYAARREQGGVEQIKDECRDMRRVGYVENFLRDVRYGLRQLRRNPGFTTVAVLTLALGIGANTAIFTIVDAVLLRPLPYRHSDRLTVIWQSDAPHRKTGAVFDTYREFEEWQAYSHSFEKLAAASWANAQETLLWHGERQEVLAIPASADFFSLLGVEPAHGRTFISADLENPCTVVLADSFWETRLGGAPEVVGGTLTLGEKSCSVAGVMPRDFSFFPKQTNL
jgi:putative ABC transport system permease protein